MDESGNVSQRNHWEFIYDNLRDLMFHQGGEFPTSGRSHWSLRNHRHLRGQRIILQFLRRSPAAFG